VSSDRKQGAKLPLPDKEAAISKTCVKENLEPLQEVDKGLEDALPTLYMLRCAERTQELSPALGQATRISLFPIKII
jgi:hypothetical protein